MLHSAYKDKAITVKRPDTQRAVTGLDWHRQNSMNSGSMSGYSKIADIVSNRKSVSDENIYDYKI